MVEVVRSGEKNRASDEGAVMKKAGDEGAILASVISYTNATNVVLIYIIATLAIIFIYNYLSLRVHCTLLDR